MAESTTSKERIIPIQLEYEPESDKIDNVTIKAKEEIEDKNIETTSDLDEEIKLNLERNLPWVNCREKIIIAIDCAEDENATNFKVDGSNKSQLTMLKHTMQYFVRTKHSINKNHEFAVVALNENNIVWKMNFTTNFNKVVNCIESLCPCEPEDIYDLTHLFEKIMDKTEVPDKIEIDGILVPPCQVVRCILLYGRSYTIPKLELTEDIELLLKSPYFVLDVMMTHEPEGSDNNITKIYKELQNIDEKGYSYFFSVERSCKKLHNSTMVLLSHPLQRPIQKLAAYGIKDWEDD